MALQVKSVKLMILFFDEELIALGEDGVPFLMDKK